MYPKQFSWSCMDYGLEHEKTDLGWVTKDWALEYHHLKKRKNLPKILKKAVFITILWTYSGSNCPNLSVKLGLPFTFSFSQDLSEKLPYYTLAGRKRGKKAFRCALIINLCVVSLLGLFRGSYISWSSLLRLLRSDEC